jgi:hypothetical protein
MLDWDRGLPRRLDLGFQPAPSGGVMHFWHREEGRRSYLTIWGYPSGLTMSENPICALVTGVGCVQSVFGYPNDDAFERDRRGDGLGHGFFEIEGSSWLTNLHEYNRKTIGSDIPIYGDVPRHYFIGSKDGSCQMLCRELLVEPFPGQSVGEVVRAVEERERLEYQENLRQIHDAIESHKGDN